MDNEAEYTDEFVSFLEIIWGEGYLSPGGPDEVGRILDGMDLTDLKVLDIGCGTGGIALALASEFGAAKVIGVDVEAPVLATANRRAAARGLMARVEFVRVEPGPLPFGDGFDLVFSKDAMIHIPDKEALFADVFRLLKPGGWFAASDWLSSHDGEPTPVMKRYMEAEGLSFRMGSPERYREALAAAGFTEIGVTNRNGQGGSRPQHRYLARHGPGPGDRRALPPPPSRPQTGVMRQPSGICLAKQPHAR
jgi:phosphoethanolamine N-methyltransferase